MSALMKTDTTKVLRPQTAPKLNAKAAAEKLLKRFPKTMARLAE